MKWPSGCELTPPTENLCGTIYELLNGSMEAAKLESVRVDVTENNFFEYRGE